ncbi:MAG: hypothetical protein ACOYVD_04225 [Bacillota bacterium]
MKKLLIILSSLLVLLFAGTTSAVAFDISSIPMEAHMQKSLDITTPNIDMSKIHDTNPLEEEQKTLLREHGYSDDQIALMDAGDFNNIKLVWYLV